MRFVEKMRIGEILDWKIFNRLSILPLLEMITRSGAGGFFRLILACCKSLGMPSRTLSRSKLVGPIRTASARARWRNKCSLSSREVKSTGPKFFVVTFPSAVIANAATTNARLRMWEGPLYRDRRDTKVPPTFSLRFAELMFERDNFLFHFAQFHAFYCATRFVKQINKSARKTANEYDHETQRPDENGFCFRNATEAIEHDLQNFLAEPNSGETDRQSGDCSFNGHDGKKINQRHPHAQRIRGKQKSGKRCKMRQNRRTKRHKGCAPMMRVKMIRREDLNQFVAARKMCRQKVEKFESTDDKCCN